MHRCIVTKSTHRWTSFQICNLIALPGRITFSYVLWLMVLMACLPSTKDRKRITETLCRINLHTERKLLQNYSHSMWTVIDSNAGNASIQQNVMWGEVWFNSHLELNNGAIIQPVLILWWVTTAVEYFLMNRQSLVSPRSFNFLIIWWSPLKLFLNATQWQLRITIQK